MKIISQFVARATTQEETYSGIRKNEKKGETFKEINESFNIQTIKEKD